MSYQIIWSDRGVIKRFYGRVTGQDTLHAVQEVESNVRFDTLRWVINDFLHINSVDLNTFNPQLVDVVSAIDMAAAKTNPYIDIAIVTNDDDIRDMAEQYANSVLNKYPTRIFTTIIEAKIWLNIPAVNSQENDIVRT